MNTWSTCEKREKYAGGEAERERDYKLCRNKTSSESLSWSTGRFLSYEVSLVLVQHHSSFKAKTC